MAQGETIRGLQRGLQVLQILQSKSTCSLHEMYEATKISKPSLLRILKTLEEFGLVSRRLADGCYRISSFGPAQKADRYDRVAEAAGPVLDQLCQTVSWPSDLMVPFGDHMQRRETSMARSPFYIPPHSKRVGQKIGWLLTAVGRAYLAFCPERDRVAILTRLRRSTNPDDYMARDPKRLESVLTEVRRRGYGTRDPFFTGWSHGGLPRDDGLAAIAVPLQGKRRTYGAINILWIRTASSVEDFAARHLQELQLAAEEIVSNIECGFQTSMLRRADRNRGGRKNQIR